jgi:hypothetical protein
VQLSVWETRFEFHVFFRLSVLLHDVCCLVITETLQDTQISTHSWHSLQLLSWPLQYGPLASGAHFLTFWNIAVYQRLPSQIILCWYIHCNDTYCVCVCGDTQSNTVQCTGDFRTQALKGIEIVAVGFSLEAWHVENNRRLFEGWGEDDSSCHYQTCRLALLSLAGINVHVMKSQAAQTGY